MTWRAIAGFRLVTQMPDRAAAFYSALGFAIDDERAIDETETARLGLHGGGSRRPMQRGTVTVDFDRYDNAGAPYPVSTAANATLFQHLALVTHDIAADWAAARAAGAMPISRDGPVALPAASGGVTAVKFRDPDGHPLELIAFPDDAVHLAIDHSAIAAADTEASIAFYAAHGLSTGDRTHNVGPAQDLLDGLDDTNVAVVPLLPEQPAPHLELLGYHRPRAIVTPPPAANDVAATRIVWHADREALVRDPDGHLHELTRA